MTNGKLDALLLEHVFGVDPSLAKIGSKGPAWYGIFLERYGALICECWAGMGLVVEEMLESVLDGDYEYYLVLTDSLNDGASASFESTIIRDNNPEAEFYTASAKSAPRAVALVALGAVGVEVDDE